MSVFLPDMKYVDNGTAERLSSAPGYPDHNRPAVCEMLRQKGHLELDDDGVAVKGLIIRHLCPPGRVGGNAGDPVLDRRKSWNGNPYLADASVFPAHQAMFTPALDRKITDDEYAEAVQALEEFGLENGWVQE